LEFPEDISKEQLINDLIDLRRRINELEKIEQDKKKYEEELAQTKAMFEGLFEFAPDAIVVVNREGRIIQVNKQTERLFGYTREELLNADHDILVPQRFREKHLKNRREYMSELRVRHMGTGLELYGRKKNGIEFPVDIALGPLQIKNDTVVLAVVRDFSQRKENEDNLKQALADLERSNKELEQFAYVASHDLQEPLRKVSGFTDLLAERYKGKLDAEADRYINYVLDGAQRMHTLINDLLTYSRVGRGTKPFARIDCNELLKQLLPGMHEGLADDAVSYGPLPIVMANESELGRVFQNLINNGTKFHRDGKPRVSVFAKQNGKEWVFSVSDNGIGIEPRFFDRIFEMFQRLHTREEYPGTGIGLAICKKIIEKHGGRIWVESQPGNGSVFYFTLPMLPGEE